MLETVVGLHERRVLRVFILGPYRSVDGSKRDLARLSLLESYLRRLGYDAFLAIHRDAVDGIDLRNLPPRQKTLLLASRSDLNLFVFTRRGVRDGLVAELTEIQVKFPELHWKHVVLLEKSLALSSILDESRGGVMSIGPLKQITFENDQELFEVAGQVAFNYSLAKAAGTKP